MKIIKEAYLDYIDWKGIGIDERDLNSTDVDGWLEKYLGEALTVSILNEALEVHDTLNPAIWDGDVLKEDVEGAIKEIVEKYVADSEILSMDDIIDIELLGSNASYNYTENSDLDIHLVVNMESLSSDPSLVQIACNAERALFNKAYEITIKGIEVELYVEDVKASTASNGIFSVTKSEWIKKPEQLNIPDVTEDEAYLGLLDTWMVRAKKAMNSESQKDVQSFINELYNLRRTSIMVGGEFAHGNLVFKEIRNSGLLQELKELVNKLASRELSLESVQ
jgi:predicted nucleotidyltransferase